MPVIIDLAAKGGTTRTQRMGDRMFAAMGGRVHAAVFSFVNDRRGQGTVEYVALILLVAAVLAGVVAATRGKQFGASGIAEAIMRELKKAVDTVH